MFEFISPILAAKYLVLSGCTAIYMSSWLGVGMLVPHQKSAPKGAGVNWKSIGAAHVDWILLGLMSVALGGLLVLFQLSIPGVVVLLVIFGAWMNPTPYVFRAFKINAFQFAGSAKQKSAALLGASSSIALLVAWTWVFTLLLLK